MDAKFSELNFNTNILCYTDKVNEESDSFISHQNEHIKYLDIYVLSTLTLSGSCILSFLIGGTQV